MGKEEQWVEALLGETYFGACTTHASVRKNERNVFCANCHIAICQHCLPSHLNHSLLQIRRYVYHDVIRLHDIEKLVNCEHVQSYIVNSAKVVFLNQRPQSRPAKGVGNACKTCDRILQDGWRFCSLACKVDAALIKGNKGGCGKGIKSIVSTPWSSFDEEADEEQLSPNCVFPELTSSSLSPSSSVSTADDTSRAVVRPILPQQPTELSKLVASSSPSTSNSIKSLNSVNSPGTLKWARTLKWPPTTAKLAKRLPFTPYSKLSITSKFPSRNTCRASKPFDSFEQCLDYHYPSSVDMPLDVAACGQYEGNFSLAKRRKGTPHRSPSF